MKSYSMYTHDLLGVERVGEPKKVLGSRLLNRGMTYEGRAQTVTVVIGKTQKSRASGIVE